MMRNRAKCKLCGDILESFVDGDLVQCNCREIAIDGGLQFLKTWAKDYANFLRVEEDGTEIAVTLRGKEEKDPFKGEYTKIKEEKPPVEAIPPPVSLNELGADKGTNESFFISSRQDKLNHLRQMIEEEETLASGVKTSPINRYDLVSYLLIIEAILKEK
jgi:hypothetical protein